MTTIITRLYATADEAKTVVGALRKEGFAKGDITVLSGDGGTGSADLMPAILEKGVYKAAAAIYADRVSQGASLLILRAPFGSATTAQALLEDTDAIDAGVKHPDSYEEAMPTRKVEWGKNLPVLLSSDVLTFSDGLFPRAVLKNWSFSSLFGLPYLTDWLPTGGSLIDGSTTPFSSRLGLPLLTERQTPYASLLGESTISSRIGVPTLTKDDSARR